MIVVDASVATKWVIAEEPAADKAFLLLQRHLEKKETILIPSLLFVEVANSLATKSQFAPAEAVQGIKLVYDANLKEIEPREEDMVRSITLAKKHGTTVYDMLYAVIAKRHKAILVTADAYFRKKTRFPFIKLLGEIDHKLG